MRNGNERGTATTHVGSAALAGNSKRAGGIISQGWPWRNKGESETHFRHTDKLIQMNALAER